MILTLNYFRKRVSRTRPENTDIPGSKIVDKACNENFQDQLSTTKQVPRPAGRYYTGSVVKGETIEQVFSGRTIASGVVELYLSGRQEGARWERHACGVACLVKDNTVRSFFIRLYDIQAQRLLWQQEIYMQFRYKTPRDYFHNFEAEWSQAGLNFASEDEAKKFEETMVSKMKQRRRRTERRRQERQLQKNVTDAQNRPPRPVSTPVTFNQKQTTPNVKAAPTKPTKTGRRLSKGDISFPTDFRRVQHIGFDTDGSFKTHITEPEMKSLLEAIGITDRDPDTMDFIYDFVGRNGGMDTIRLAMSNMSKSATPVGPPTRPPSPRPPPRLSSQSDQVPPQRVAQPGQRPPPSPKQGLPNPPRQTPSRNRDPPPPPARQEPLMPRVRQPLVPAISPSSYPYLDRAVPNSTRPPPLSLRPAPIACQPSSVNTAPSPPQIPQRSPNYKPMAPSLPKYNLDPSQPSSVFVSGRPQAPPPPPPKQVTVAPSPYQRDSAPPPPYAVSQAPLPPPPAPPLAPPPPAPATSPAPPPPPPAPPLTQTPPPAPLPGDAAAPNQLRTSFLKDIESGVALKKVEVGTSDFKRRQSRGDGLIPPPADESGGIIDMLRHEIEKRKNVIHGSDDEDFDAEGYDQDWDEDEL